MKITLEQLSPSQVKLEVAIAGTQSQAVYDRTVQKLVRNVQIPGFRKGKAPRELVLRQTGIESIKASVFEELMRESVVEILKNHADLKIVGEFQLDRQSSELLQEFQAGQDFSFVLLVDVVPEFDLPQYTGFDLQVVKVEPDLTSSDRTLHEYRIRRSTLVPVEGRPAQLGDVATFDMKVYDSETGTEIEEFSGQDNQIDLEPESFIPEIVTALVGASVGDTIEVTAKLPETMAKPDRNISETVRFVLTLNDLKMRELPPLDDEFARAISEKQTMAELRQFLDQRAIDEAQRQTERNIQRAIYDALIAQINIELPQSMIEKEIDYLVRQQLQYLQSQMDDKILKQVLNREMIQQMRQMAKPEAIARVKRSMAIAKVAELEGIKVEPDELNKQMEQILPYLDPKKIDPADVAASVNSELLVEKVMAWLIERSSIKYVPEPAEANSPTLTTPPEEHQPEVPAN
jgi:trigger factor